MTTDEFLKRFPHATASTLRANAALISDAPQSCPSPSAKVPVIAAHGPGNDAAESESQIQQRVIKWWADWCATKGLPECVLMAFPLQGKRSRANGARMKAEGMRAGTPDLLLAVARNDYHGLWVEMKRPRPKGRLEVTQHEMLSALNKQGYAAVACFGFDEAISVVSRYLIGESVY